MVCGCRGYYKWSYICEKTEIALSLRYSYNTPTARLTLGDSTEKFTLAYLLTKVSDLSQIASEANVTNKCFDIDSQSQIAITILWLAKAARKQGYQGPTLDVSCFNHLIPVRSSLEAPGGLLIFEERGVGVKHFFWRGRGYVFFLISLSCV